MSATKLTEEPKEEVQPAVVVETKTKDVIVEEFLTIDQFLDKQPAMKKAVRYYYKNNFNTVDMRTEAEWKIITKLN